MLSQRGVGFELHGRASRVIGDDAPYFFACALQEDVVLRPFQRVGIVSISQLGSCRCLGKRNGS